MRYELIFLVFVTFVICNKVMNVSRRKGRRKQKQKESEFMMPFFENLDLIANRFAQRMAMEANNEVEWLDLYGKNPILQGNADFKLFQVNIKTNEMIYGESVTKDAKIRSPVSHWLENYGTEPKLEEFVCDYTTHFVHIWKVTKGLRTRREIKVPIKLREGIRPGTYQKINLKKPKIQIPLKKQKSFQSRFKVPIPPKKAISVDCFVTGSVVDVPWAVDVEIYGWIAVWFKNRLDNHYLWFYRITELVNDQFEVSPDGCSLTYKASGLFRMIDASDSHNIFYEHNLTISNDTDDSDKKTCNLTANQLLLDDNDPCKYQGFVISTPKAEKEFFIQKTAEGKWKNRLKQSMKPISEKVDQFKEMKPGAIAPNILPPPL